ncbi:MAG: hypothetical protein HZA90_29030 [Verrucomicrobia bacterium]|nr:hypothetical protein [Verrucomicrobiota bacterium]
MKKLRILTLAALGLAACLQPASAQLTIPSDGSDGAFNPSMDPTNVVIDLSQAVPGVWNANNSANAGRGIYDKDKWAIVFKYSSVNIPAGVTVRFINHSSRAPVVWLVQGDVAVAGTVDLRGQSKQQGSAALLPTEPGPGGFRGGPTGPQGGGIGLGPGGGAAPSGGGAYATFYGNPRILPLIGGSGGRAGGTSGGAGGGALFVAASGTVTVNGLITAQGGVGAINGGDYFGGSGGAIRIIASQVLGTGELNCLLGVSGYNYSGLEGRIRIESPLLSAALRTHPETIADLPATPPEIWPPAATPTVRIVSVDTNAAPTDPTAPLLSNADVAIYNDTPVVITLETTDFPIEGVVQVRAAQKWGSASWIRAWYVSGNQAQAQWRATNTFVKGYTTLQARATAP